MRLDWERVGALVKGSAVVAGVGFMLTQMVSCSQREDLTKDLVTLTKDNIQYKITDDNTAEVTQKPLTMTYNFAVRFAYADVSGGNVDSAFFFNMIEKERLADALKTSCSIPVAAEIKFRSFDVKQKEQTQKTMNFLRKFHQFHCI